MNCKDISKLFTAYLDGEVTSEEQEQIQAHLSACQHCGEELEALATTQNSLRHALKVTAAGATPSPQAWAGLQQRLEAEEQPRVTIWGLAKSKVKGGIDIMIQGLIRGLTSRQPVWKSVIAGVLAVALIAGLVIALPLLTRQSPEALAADIAKNSPQVQAALGSGEVEVLRVITVDDKALVILYREETGQHVLARVDLETAEVTEIAVVSMPTELTEAEKEEAVAIAKADPSIKELLDQGASIDRVTLARFLTLGIHPDEILLDEVVLDEETDFAIGKGALIYLRLGDRMWSAIIDLEGKKFLRLHIGGLTEAEKEEAINIAKTDPRVQELLDKGAEIRLRGVHGGEEGIDKIALIVKMPGEELGTIVEVDLAEGKVVDIIPEIREFGNVHPTLGGRRLELTEAGEREPLIEIEERANEYLVEAELPGVKTENIDLDASENRLKIKAADTRKYATEVRFDEPVDPEKIDAEYKDGVLKVTLPKRGKEVRRISIRG
ncbi:Hsp20 family protein [Dehalococcoidales bacterium]|nr:Hsp20 family protein [Dehalococcoidales bacterium]